MECDNITENKNLMIMVDSLNEGIKSKIEIISNLLSIIASSGNQELINKTNEYLKTANI